MSYARNLARLARTGAPTVDTAQALRDMPIYGGLYPERVETLGALAAGDGGGGPWRWDPDSTEDDNIGTVLLPAGHVGAGRWVRVLNGPVCPEMWGGMPDGTTDCTAAFAAMTAWAGASVINTPTGGWPERSYGREIRLNAGTYVLTDTISFDMPRAGGEFYDPGVTIRGAGRGNTWIQNDGTGPALEFLLGSWTVSDFTIRASGTGASGLKIGGDDGTDSELAHQSAFERIMVVYAEGHAFDIWHCFDSTLLECTAAKLSGAGSGFNFRPLTTGCQNNVSLINCHAESREDTFTGSLLAVGDNPAGSCAPASMRFMGLHLELHGANGRMITVGSNGNLTNLIHATFINLTAYVAPTASATELPIELWGCRNTQFIGGYITSVVPDPGTKLVGIRAGTSDVTFRDLRMLRQPDTPSSIDAVFEFSNPSDPLGDMIDVSGLHLSASSRVPTGRMPAVGDTNGPRARLSSYVAGGLGVIGLERRTDATTASAWAHILGVGPSGGISSMEQTEIAAGATLEIQRTNTANNNPSLMLIGSTAADTGALLWAYGDTVSALAAGSAVDVGNAAPTNKIGVTATATQVILRNGYAAPVNVFWLLVAPQASRL